MPQLFEIENVVLEKEGRERHLAELIVRHLFNDLSSDQRKKVEGHLSECSQCRERARAIRIVFSAAEPDESDD